MYNHGELQFSTSPTHAIESMRWDHAAASSCWDLKQHSLRNVLTPSSRCLSISWSVFRKFILLSNLARR